MSIIPGLVVFVLQCDQHSEEMLSQIFSLLVVIAAIQRCTGKLVLSFLIQNSKISTKKLAPLEFKFRVIRNVKYCTCILARDEIKLLFWILFSISILS